MIMQKNPFKNDNFLSGGTDSQKKRAIQSFAIIQYKVF